MRVDMAQAPSALTLAAAAATFSALGLRHIKVTGDAGANSVTTITDGVAGEFLAVEFVDGFVTLVHGNTANKPFLKGAANFTGAAGDIVLFIKTSTYWLEVARNDLSGVPAPPFTTATFSDQITSTLVTGTAPMVIASTTKVTNLNVDKVDGQDWADPGAIGGGTPAAVTGTTITANTKFVGQKPVTAQIGVTATVDGLTTGIIPDTAENVLVTSSVNTKLVTLPTPTPGARVKIYCSANGYKLQSSNLATVKINDVADGAKVLAVASTDELICDCVDATHWSVMKIDKLGAPATAGVPA